MKHSSGASSPVNGCLSLKQQPNQVMKKKSIARDFFSSVMCFILSNLVFVLRFIKRRPAVGCPTRGRCSVLLIDLWWASNKAELDFMWCIRKAVWNQSNQSAWMISAYRRPNGRQQSQTLLQLWWRALTTVIARAATGGSHFLNHSGPVLFSFWQVLRASL